MTGGQAERSLAHLAVAIVVAALVIGAAILASSYLEKATTQTSTVTTTAPNIHAATLSSTSASEETGSTDQSTATHGSVGQSATGLRVYEVTFIQTAPCADPAYTSPWSVTLGNETEVEPANGTVPTPGEGFSGSPANMIYSMIVFAVPNGSYNYSVSPSAAFDSNGPPSGVLTVNGADVTVRLQVAPACISVTQDATTDATSP